jgi:MoxR-like ATPase
VAYGVLSHRLILRPEAEIEGRDATTVIRDALEGIPVLQTD